MGEDIIKRANDGTYYFRASLGFHPDTGKRIQKRKSGFRTKKEARDAFAKLVIENPDEIVKEQSDIKFNTFVEEYYLPWYKTNVRLSTYENRIKAIRKHFAFFSHLKVGQIKPLHVQKWQVKLSEEYSNHYIRMVQGFLSMALDRAIILGLAKDNPSRTVGNVKRTKVKIEFWTKEEFEKVMSNIYIDDFYQNYLFVTIWLLFMSGMRVGEATALQWSDFDSESGLLSIDKSLFYKNAQNYSFSEPKTKAGVRKLYLDTYTVEILKNWKERQESLFKTGFILSYNSIPTNKHTISYAITRFAKMADVHRITVHGLRHSHASLLISMGENPLIIKDRLGHEDIETTLGTYGHLYPNSNFDVANKLNGIINFSPASENKDTSPTNQHTFGYIKNCATTVPQAF